MWPASSIRCKRKIWHIVSVHWTNCGRLAHLSTPIYNRFRWVRTPRHTIDPENSSFWCSTVREIGFWRNKYFGYILQCRRRGSRPERPVAAKCLILSLGRAREFRHERKYLNVQRCGNGANAPTEGNEKLANLLADTFWISSFLIDFLRELHLFALCITRMWFLCADERRKGFVG